MPNTDELVRRRPVILSFDGIVKKSGEGWFLVEQDAPEETIPMAVVTGEGKAASQIIRYLPFSVLVTFAKNKDMHSKVVPDAVMRFAVEVSIGWDQKFKKCVPRFWLVDCQPLDDYMQNVLKVAQECGMLGKPDAFEEVKKALEEPKEAKPKPQFKSSQFPR